jgi:hypothetical protein
VTVGGRAFSRPRSEAQRGRDLVGDPVKTRSEAVGARCVALVDPRRLDRPMSAHASPRVGAHATVLDVRVLCSVAPSARARIDLHQLEEDGEAVGVVGGDDLDVDGVGAAT